MKYVFLGRSISASSSGDHAPTYRGLVRELARRGHDVLFLERDAPGDADARDLPPPPGTTRLYASLDELRSRWTAVLRRADVVVVGSGLREGVAVGRWALEEARGIVAFYDLDPPGTLARLSRGEAEDLRPELIPGFDLYLSFTAGPLLEAVERDYGSPCARALLASADPGPAVAASPTWDLGCLPEAGEGPKLERLLAEPARRLPGRRFVVAGAGAGPEWPANVERVAVTAERSALLAAQRFTLCLTRDDRARAGWSPGVRLFEAAARGASILSDRWAGLEELFEPGRELLVVEDADDVVRALSERSDAERRALGARARERVLAAHTAAHRAAELERFCREV